MTENVRGAQEILFDVASLEKEELRRQQRMFYLFTAVLVPYDLLYGFFWLRQGDGFFSTILICSGIVLVLNWLAYLWHRQIVFAKPLITITSIINLTALLPTGGIDRTGIYWMNLFPPLTYLFQGVRLGLMYNVVFFLGLIGISAARDKGLLEIPYSPTEMKQMWSALLCMNLLGYAAESGWDRSRRRIAEQVGRMRAIIAGLPVGVVMVEKDGTPSAANESVERLFGRPVSADVNAIDFSDKFRFSKENGAPFPSDELPLNIALKTGVAARVENLFVSRPDGTRAILRVAAAPIKDRTGQVVAAVAAYEDMTKEHEINRMKSEFISLASHQLKVPLTSVKWSIESLLSGDRGSLTEAQQETAGELNGIVDRLLRLVTDLLTLSRIESGRKYNIKKVPTDVVPILAGVVREIGNIARPKGVVVSMTGLPERLVLDVDADKFREVFANLVSNAVKYCRNGGQAVIGIERAVQADTAILMVSDDGVGIPKEQHARVFERFFRASNVEEDIEGTGLGLYIVKEIVERHGGRVWFKSDEGKGTTFFVELPTAS